ncbi:DUF3310 domain-containing protein [Prescottella equi]|nr:DUF3310 domain-containing protein [Prescottella equi]
MSDDTTDPVNHPGHYTSHPSGVECIQVTEHMSFCLGNAVKYIWRADLKGNAIEDLQKARWYVDREIARLGGQPAILDGLAESGELTEAVKTSLTDALDTVLSATGMSVPVLDSGPDGTPEKLWPTWQDVPEGVRYWHGDGRPNPCLAYWVNQGGVRMHGDAALHEPIPSVIDDIDKFAPFVRVDGDKE